MPSVARILIVLALVLPSIVGVHLSEARKLQPARWPTDDAVFSVPGWTVSSASVETVDTSEETGATIQRKYNNRDSGIVAELVIWTHPEPQAKTQFRKGPDRDLLGDGYTIEPTPAGLVAPIQGGGVLIARQGDHAWLGLYTFGEKRGRLGNGLQAWSLAELDSLLDQPNDYYLARVLVPYNAGDAAAAERVSNLAAAVFDRLARWYSD